MLQSWHLHPPTALHSVASPAVAVVTAAICQPQVRQRGPAVAVDAGEHAAARRAVRALCELHVLHLCSQREWLQRLNGSSLHGGRDVRAPLAALASSASGRAGRGDGHHSPSRGDVGPIPPVAVIGQSLRVGVSRPGVAWRDGGKAAY